MGNSCVKAAHWSYGHYHTNCLSQEDQHEIFMYKHLNIFGLLITAERMMVKCHRHTRTNVASLEKHYVHEYFHFTASIQTWIWTQLLELGMDLGVKHIWLLLNVTQHKCPGSRQWKGPLFLQAAGYLKFILSRNHIVHSGNPFTFARITFRRSENVKTCKQYLSPHPQSKTDRRLTCERGLPRESCPTDLSQDF